MSKITKATTGREDFSQLIVHLTRDYNGKTAKENLTSIIKSGKIEARNPHNIFNQKLRDSEKSKFNIVCFTETPLHQLHLLVQTIPGRQVKLEPYGLVFRKNFILAQGGHPALYINSYNKNMEVRNSIDNIFSPYFNDNTYKFKDEAQKIIPFLNAMHDKYDFSWEREWRFLGDFSFPLSEIVALICPKNEEPLFQPSVGIAVISPGFSYEEIVFQLILQYRNAVVFWQKSKNPS